MKQIIKKIGKRLYFGIPYTWRIPSIYYKTLRSFEGVNSIEEIKKWQLDKTKAIISHAYNNISGYHAIYVEAGVSPNDLQTLDDIRYFPIIEKETLCSNIKEFTNPNIPKWKLHQSRTSGSTGMPFGFYKTIAEEWVEQAFVGKAWGIGGWNINQSGIILRGAYAGDAEHIYRKCDNGSFYVHNNSYMLSPNFLTNEYYPIYKEFLVSHPELSYIFALPSSITLLSQLLIAHLDEGISNVEAIYLGSESIYDWQYGYIQKAFPKANIISLYGQTERVIMAYWCADSRMYHVDPFYGLTEVLNNNLDVAEGERGELIGTSFWNTTTPFIRYRTKDFAIKGPNSCSNCGLNYLQLERIDGRLQDVLVGREGRCIPYNAFDGSLLHGSVFKDIVRFKIIQYEKGVLKFQIQVTSDFNAEKKNIFEKIITDYLGEDFTSTIEVVKEILPGKNGKFNIVEQHLPIDISTRVKN